MMNMAKLKLKHGVILVALFLLIFIWWGSSRAEMRISIGPSQVGTEFSTGTLLVLSQRLDNMVDLNIGYISPQHFDDWSVREQIFAGVEFLVFDPWSRRFNLGLGPYLFQNADRIGTSRFRMGLSLGWRINNRLGLEARHYSLAGSGPEITACNDFGQCFTNDWNTGQDSWLRGVWHF